MADAAIVINRLKIVVAISAWRNTWRALKKSFAPMKCATWTEKPIDAALVILPNSHVDDSTRPMDADACAPRRPTIEASIKNIITLVICARMDGMLNPIIRFSFSLPVIGLPSRIAASNMSVFLMFNVFLFECAKVRQKRQTAKYYYLFHVTISRKKAVRIDGPPF